jgi:hypothetical protein
MGILGLLGPILNSGGANLELQLLLMLLGLLEAGGAVSVNADHPMVKTMAAANASLRA